MKRYSSLTLLVVFLLTIKIAVTAAIVVPKITPPTAGCPNSVIAVATAVSMTTTKRAIHCPRFSCETLPLQILSSCLCRCSCSFSAITNILSAEPASTFSYPPKISGCGIGPLKDSCCTAIWLTTNERSASGNCSKDSRTDSAVTDLADLADFICRQNICELNFLCHPRLLSSLPLQLSHQICYGAVYRDFHLANSSLMLHPKRIYFSRFASLALKGLLCVLTCFGMD